MLFFVFCVTLNRFPSVAWRDSDKEDRADHLQVGYGLDAKAGAIIHTNHLSFSQGNKTQGLRSFSVSDRRVSALAGRSLVVTFGAQDEKIHVEDQSFDTSHLDHVDAPQTSFESWAKTFPWENYRGNATADAINDLIKALIPFAALEHPVPGIPLSSCELHEGRTDKALSCGDFPKVFRGKRLGRPAVIIDAFVFGYDLDLLEVRLNELDAVVDLFALIEMPLSHKGLPKPLVYATHKKQPRFNRFHHKLLHIVVNDEGVARLQEKYLGNAPWDSVNHQEQEGVRKLRQGFTHIFGSNRMPENVVLSFGDLDEIPSVEGLKLMKECDPWDLPIDQGSWFPFGRFDRAFLTDWPVESSLPYTFGNPSFFDLSDFRGRQYGKNGREHGRYLLGGWHLTGSAYLPNHLMKTVMCHDSDGLDDGMIRLLQEEGGARETFKQIQDLPPQFQARVSPVSELISEEPSTAWRYRPPRYMACNKERFELWYGIYDRRHYLNPSPAT